MRSPVVSRIARFRAAGSPTPFELDYLQSGDFARKTKQKRCRAVCRSVVDDRNFEDAVTGRLRHNAADRLFDEALLIVAGHDHRDAHA